MDARPVVGLRGPVVQLSGSYNRVCVRHEAGTVDCWGTGHTPVTNRPLPVPTIDDAIDLSVGSRDACVVRKHDGSGDPVWTIPLVLPGSRVGLAAADATKLVVVGYEDNGGDFDPGPAADIIKARGLFITRYAF